MSYLHGLLPEPLRGMLLAGCAAWWLTAAAAPAAEAGAASRPGTGPAATAATTRSSDAGGLNLRKGPARGLPTLSDSDQPGYLGRMLAYALVVLVLGAGAAVLVRKYRPRGRAAGGRKMRVVDSMFLGPRKQLLVLEVGSRKFLVASCRDSVSPIAEITDSFSEVYEKHQVSADAAAETPAGDAGGEDRP